MTVVCLVVSHGVAWGQGLVTVDLDDLPLSAGSYWNGSDGSGGFSSASVTFPNHYTDYGGGFYGWAGFSYSSVNDTNTSGYGNQYAVSSGTGYGGDGVYGVGYWNAFDSGASTMGFPEASRVRGLYVNNTTYAALDMRDGSDFSKKFGGDTGDDPDWFLLTIVGKDANGTEVGTVEHYLADYRNDTNSEDYITTDWDWVDLTVLGTDVKDLHFSLSSSDNGDFGMNTPSYFAFDSVQYVTKSNWLDAAGPYAPAVGYAGTTAVDKDAASLVAWATGWTDYVVGANCDEQWRTPDEATGKAEGASSNIVCLGEAGRITMTFDTPIMDGPGGDFAVFENSVNDTFLELAYVEVSSDGTNFFRFPNFSLTPGPVGAFGSLFPTNIHGLGCKYRQGYGEPFDLADVAASAPGLDTDNVRWVRLKDVSGDGSFMDSVGRTIYDPYLATGSAGFDLDAIGVMSNAIEEVYLRSVTNPGMELGPSNAVFEVVRKSWDISTNLVVHLAVAGTASNGIDYAHVAVTSTIPAGATTSTIEIVPIQDTLAEGDETVEICVLPHAAYVVGRSSNVALRIEDLPVDEWRRDSFGAGAGTPEAADAADWDEDGVFNLMEYSLALNATNGTDSVEMSISLVPSNGVNLVAVTYDRRADLPDATVRLEVTEDLVTGEWSSGDTHVEETIVGASGDRVTIRAVVKNSGGADNRAMRLTAGRQ